MNATISAPVGHAADLSIRPAEPAGEAIPPDGPPLEQTGGCALEVVAYVISINGVETRQLSVGQATAHLSQLRAKHQEGLWGDLEVGFTWSLAARPRNISFVVRPLTGSSVALRESRQVMPGRSDVGQAR